MSIFRLSRTIRQWLFAGSVGVALIATTDSFAQIEKTGHRPRIGQPIPICNDCPPPVVQPPVMRPPVMQPVTPPNMLPPSNPPVIQPMLPMQPAPMQPTPPMPEPPVFMQPQQPLLTPESGLALGDSSFALSEGGGPKAGYIDPAIPASRIRVRYDSMYGNNRPDRAEFFYGKCGCFRNGNGDEQAPGPPLAETNVDTQEQLTYIEYATSNRFSVFTEVPIRFINPDLNRNASGVGDLQFGFKYAFIAEQDEFLTFQMRTYVPTGSAGDGLGTNHFTLEPGFLYYRALSDRLVSESEFRVWIPIGGRDFSGTILRYGTGLSYTLINEECYRFSPVLEVVGWTVTNGMGFNALANRTDDASGATIINAKIGGRFGFGEQLTPGFSRYDIYAGYGRALTGEVWYENLFRLEGRINF